MNYLVAVLADRVQAEAAYSALEKEGLPSDKVAILGKGYKSADEFGLIDPSSQARKQSTGLALWLTPFGFVAGYVFNVLSGLNTFPWAGGFGNHLIGGLLGAASGAFGSFVVGSGVGLTSGSGDALPYRNRLNAGKYLLVVKGSANLTDQARRVLRQFEPENLQGYIDSDSV